MIILPAEILDRVIQFLDFSDINRLSYTCKKLHQFVERPIIWKQLLHRTQFDIYTTQNESSHPHTDSKDYYQAFKGHFLLAKGWRVGQLTKHIVRTYKEILVSIQVRNGSIYCGSISGKLYALGEKEMSVSAHTDALSCLQINNNYFFSGSWNKTVKVSVQTPFSFSVVRSLNFESPIISTLLDVDGFYVGLGDGSVHLVDTKSFKTTFLCQHEGSVTKILCYGPFLIIGVGRTVVFWHIDSQLDVHTLHYPSETISGLVVIGDTLFVSTNDGVVLTWFIPSVLEQGEDVPPLNVLAVHPGSGIRFMLGIGQLITTASYDGSIAVLKMDGETQELLLLYKLLAHRGDVNGLAYYNGKLYSCGDDGKVIEWKVDFGAVDMIKKAVTKVSRIRKPNTGYTWADAAEWVLSQEKNPVSCLDLLELMREKQAYPGMDDKPTPGNTLNQTLHFWSKQNRPRFKCTNTKPNLFSIHPQSTFTPIPPPHLELSQ